MTDNLAMQGLPRSLTHDEQGQDIVEYTLLVAFIAFTTALLTHGLGSSVAGITSTSNTQLAAANAIVR